MGWWGRQEKVTRIVVASLCALVVLLVLAVAAVASLRAGQDAPTASVTETTAQPDQADTVNSSTEPTTKPPTTTSAAPTTTTASTTTTTASTTTTTIKPTTTTRRTASSTPGVYSQLAAIDKEARAKVHELQDQIDQQLAYYSDALTTNDYAYQQTIKKRLADLQQQQQAVIDEAEAQKAALLDKAVGGD